MSAADIDHTLSTDEAFDVLSSFPDDVLVSDVFNDWRRDDAEELHTALNTLFPDYEYPDVSHRLVHDLAEDASREHRCHPSY